jgi:hypothetical protein
MTGASNGQINDASAPFSTSGGGGIASINGDTTSAQLITGGTGISISTSSGDTVITATGGTGVTSLNSETGALTLTSTGSTITITEPTGSTINLEANGGSSVAFTAITSGTNTAAAMVVGSGASIAPSGSGAITATIAPAGTLTGTTLVSNVIASSLTSVGALSSGSLTTGFTAVNPAQGGTGQSSLTAHAVLLGEGTSAVGYATIGTAGNLLIDQGSGNDPIFEPMSGDATIVKTGALTFATVNSNTGSFGSSTSIPNFTVNGKGLITAAGGNAVIAPAGTLSGTTLNSTVVTSSLTTVGTIGTGVWQGTKIADAYGGTGADSSVATGVAQVNSGTWSWSTALANGTTATTQSAGDNSTKVATTAYVNSAVSSGDAFSSITSGTNTTAAMVVGSGATLGVSGSGTIAATSAPAGALTGTTLASNVVTSSITTLGTSASLPGSPTTTTQTALTNNTTIATTAYTDAAVATAVAGINPAVAVQAATTSAGNTSGLTYNNGISGVGATFTGTNNTALVIDGYTFTLTGQRLLVKNDTQSANPGAYNGIYYVTQIQTSITPPILTRALDYDQPSDINNTGAIPVINGTVNASTTWVETAQVVTVGTTPLVYAQFSYNPSSIVTNFSAGSTGLTPSSATSGAITLAGTLAITSGGTGQISAGAAFNALSPMTTGGDIIYGGVSGTGTRLANGSAGQVLQSNGTTLAPSWATISGTGTVTNVTFTGDGTILSSTPSSAVTTSGTLTAALANAGPGTVLGNITGTAASPTYTSVPVLGAASSMAGTLGLASSSQAGIITFKNLAAPSSYNFNLPTTAGTAGQVLTSQGGGSTSMTWGSGGGGVSLGLVYAISSGNLVM